MLYLHITLPSLMLCYVFFLSDMCLWKFFFVLDRSEWLEYLSCKFNLPRVTATYTYPRISWIFCKILVNLMLTTHTITLADEMICSLFMFLDEDENKTENESFCSFPVTNKTSLSITLHRIMGSFVPGLFQNIQEWFLATLLCNMWWLTMSNSLERAMSHLL